MGSKDIAFTQIPEGRRTPGVYTEQNLSGALTTLPANNYKVVAVGQRLAGGAAVAGQIVDIFSSDDAALAFGRGSTLHLAIMDAIKANSYLSLQAVAVDDALAGVAASGTLTVTGPATGSGALTVGVNENNVPVAVANGDSASVIATNIAAAINAQPNLQVTAAALVGVVTFAAKNKGTLGNAIVLSSKVNAAGVTAVASAMTGGLNDPDMTPALTAIFAAGHDIIISCFNDAANNTALRSHLNSVSSPLEKRWARAVIAVVGTYAQAVTTAAAINSGRIMEVLVPNAYEASYEVAGVAAAIAASEPDPARPLNYMELVGLTPPPMQSWLNASQIEAALNNGVTPTKVGPGNVVQIVRAVTTYTLNSAGVADATLLDWTTLGTFDYIAKAITMAAQLQCPRDKKTARSVQKLTDVVYEVLLKSQDAELVKNVQKTDILIEDDLSDVTRTNARIKINLVSGQHIIGTRLDLAL